MGIESQQHIHYAMPLRHMVYDAMSYLKEYQEITRRYKKEKEKTIEDEFLSKMRKEDRLHLFIKCVWKSRGTPVGGRLMKIVVRVIDFV